MTPSIDSRLSISSATLRHPITDAVTACSPPIDWHYHEWMFKPATVLSYGAQGGLAATEHLRGVFAELHVVTTRRTVGLRAPWNDVDAGTFTPPPGVDTALDEALGELAWWADVLRDARRDRPFDR